MNSFPATTVTFQPAKKRALAPAAFSVNARVAMQLGRESIATSNTAIVELVKNAYDADADSVRIRFRNLGTDRATLVIEDNGNGMTEDEIRDYWLCIGTTNKQDIDFSRKNKRVQTGEKGLGRLGLDRLSRRTLLQTKRRVLEDDPEQLKLFLSEFGPRALELIIEWDRYTVRGQRLETVAHEVNELEHLDIDPITGFTGVKLAEALREHFKEMLIYVVTGHAIEGELTSEGAGSSDGVVPKPSLVIGDPRSLVFKQQFLRRLGQYDRALTARQLRFRDLLIKRLQSDLTPEETSELGRLEAERLMPTASAESEAEKKVRVETAELGALLRRVEDLIKPQ